MKRLFVLLFAALLLAACGSNGDVNQETDSDEGQEQDNENVNNTEEEVTEKPESEENDGQEESQNNVDEEASSEEELEENINKQEQTENTNDNGNANGNENVSEGENAGLTDEQVNEVESKVGEEVDGDNGEEYSDFQFFIDNFDYDKGTNTVTIRIAVEDDPLPTQEEAREYTQHIAGYAGSEIINEDFKVVVSSVLKAGQGEYTKLVVATYANGETAYNEAKGIEELE